MFDAYLKLVPFFLVEIKKNVDYLQLDWIIAPMCFY